MDQYILYSFEALAFFLFICLLAYIPRLIGWFAALKKDPILHNDKQNRIAILIPARDESATISGLLNNLHNQTYKNFDVFVIVRDKKDPSIGIAHSFGFHSHIASNQTCKGDALDSCLHSIMRRDRNGFDAYLIIDADCMVKPDYVEKMNDGLASGRQVILSRKLVKNYEMNGRVRMQQACNGIIWTLMDEMGNRFRSRHGYTAFTVGTGIMIRRDIIEINDGWPYRSTMTEDMEFMNDIAANGYSTFYYPYAIIYMEEAPSLSMTNKRRKRWMTGVVDARRLYDRKVKLMATRPNRYYVHCLWIIYFYIGAATIYSASLGIMSFCLACLGDPSWLMALIVSLSALSIVYLSFFAMTSVAVIIEWKNIKMSFIRKIALLFIHPVFYMHYIKIVAGALLHLNSKKWDPIARVNEETKTEEII